MYAFPGQNAKGLGGRRVRRKKTHFGGSVPESGNPVPVDERGKWINAKVKTELNWFHILQEFVYLGSNDCPVVFIL